MYKIIYNNHTIFDDENRAAYPCLSCNLSLEVNTSGSLKFTLPSTHENVDKPQPLEMQFKVIKNSKTIFKGQLINKPSDFRKTKEFYVEGKFASLTDSIYRPYDFAGMPEDLFKKLIENHNKQVDPGRQFKIGEITAKDKNDYIHLSSESYSTTMEVLKKLRESIGGYINVRYEEDGDYIDWLADYPLTNVQKIEFAKNLLDLTEEKSAEETYSACIPLGKKDEETKKYVTVESVNQGSDIIYNQELVNKIGWRFAPPSTVTWEDVTRPENLKTKAENWLNNQGVMLNETLSLNAIDLHYADKSIESFDFGKYIHVISKPHNLEKLYLLSKIDIDILHPENTVIQLGEKRKTLYESLKGTEGKPGPAGKTTFLHIAYADTPDGKDGFSKTESTGKAYIGQYADFDEAGSDDYQKYKWSKIKGDPGKDGADGLQGKNGRGIKETTNLYYLSDSAGSTVGGDWTETQPQWQQGKYIWMKQRTLFDDGTQTESKAILLENLTGILKDTEAVKQELETVTSKFIQTAEAVTMGIVSNYSKITDLENLKAEITNQLVTDKNGFNFEFKTLEQKLTQLGNEVSLQKKWIRLVDGEIHMGREDSPIDTVYTSKSLEFRYNGATVAEFTNDFLNVRNVEIKNQLRLTSSWAIRPGEYIQGKGYNLNDVWIGE